MQFAILGKIHVWKVDNSIEETRFLDHYFTSSFLDPRRPAREHKALKAQSNSEKNPSQLQVGERGLGRRRHLPFIPVPSVDCWG